MKFLILVLFSTQLVYAEDAFMKQTLLDVARSNLRFIQAEQTQKTDDVYLKGEWPTWVRSTTLPFLVGVGSKFDSDGEPTPFTTAAVTNQLSSIYIENHSTYPVAEIQNIPELVADAATTFARYQEGDLFNFYPPRQWRGHRVHQPIDMKLLPMWKGFTNIPQDADTSSTTYTSLYYNSFFKNESFEMPAGAKQAFSNFRDIDRAPLWYNKSEHRVNTHAFMTWLIDENDPSLPHFWFAPPQKGTRIPFNRNDVDCIVNVNVLRALALTQNTSQEGCAEACTMVNDMVVKSEEAQCGIYYPNTYNLAYSLAQLNKAGSDCVQESTKIAMLKHILSTQTAQGGWTNKGNSWKDEVQSTAFAMTALLEFADSRDPKIKSALDRGTKFLLMKMIVSDEGEGIKPYGLYYFNGEVFFTATAIARSLVNWRSHSFTTAIAAGVFLKMNTLFPDQDVHYYFSKDE